MERPIDVWVEGRMVNGKPITASKLVTFTAESYTKVVEILHEIEPKDVFKVNGHWTFWGSRIFDNEVDARKAFG